MHTTRGFGKPRAHGRRGNLLLEALVSTTLFSIVMLSAMAMIESGNQFSRSTIEVTAIEDLAQQMLYRIERDLANATGHEPETELTVAVAGPGAQEFQVSTTTGFPSGGYLIVDRGTAFEEWVEYRRLEPTETRFQLLDRGIDCSEPQAHLDNAPVTWAGLAVPIANQINPTADEFDGQAMEDLGPVFFRGRGTGFSFRIPVDPAGGNNPLNGDDLFWGADVPTVGQTEDGWMAYQYVPELQFDERARDHDLNGDGDRLDVFDIGQIRRLTWDRTDSTRVQDLAMGPSRILQERCEWGSDLDNDGFDDPIFLWDPDTNLLHVRLMLIGSSMEYPITRMVETSVFLRNEPEI